MLRIVAWFVLSTIYLSFSLVFAIPYQSYHGQRLLEGMRTDRLTVLQDLLEREDVLEAEFLKKTLIAKVVCNVESPFAQKECDQLNSYYLSQKKVPYLLDFPVDRYSTRWILKTLINVLKAALPAAASSDQSRLQSAITLAGIALAQEVLTSESAEMILKSLDKTKPWYQMFVENQDFKVYQPLLDEIIAWLTIRPSEPIYQLIWPYTEMMSDNSNLICSLSTVDALRCEGYAPSGMANIILAKSIDNLKIGLRFDRSFSNREVEFNEHSILPTRTAPTSMALSHRLIDASSERDKDKNVWQFTRGNDLSCSYDGRQLACRDNQFRVQERLKEIDPEKILRIFASGQYLCAVYSTGVSSDMACSGPGPFPSFVSDVAFVVGSQSQGCVVGHKAGWRCFGQKEFIPERMQGVIGIAIEDQMACMKTDGSESFRCWGKVHHSPDRKIVADDKMQSIEGINFFKQGKEWLYLAGLEVDSRVQTLLASEQAKPFSLLKALEGLKDIKQIMPYKITRNGWSVYALTTDAKVYAAHSKTADKPPLLFVSDFHRFPKEDNHGLWERQWPLPEQDSADPFGVIEFANENGRCFLSRNETHCTNVQVGKEFTRNFILQDSPKDVFGILANGCYLTENEIVCKRKRNKIPNVIQRDIFFVSPENETRSRGGLLVPEICVKGHEEPVFVCLNEDGDRIDFPFKVKSFDSLILRRNYLCLKENERTSYCSSGDENFHKIKVKREQDFHFGHESLYYLRSSSLFDLNGEVVLQGILGLWGVSSGQSEIICYKDSVGVICDADSVTKADQQNAILFNRPYIDGSKRAIVRYDSEKNICVKRIKEEEICNRSYSNKKPYRVSLEKISRAMAVTNWNYPNAFCWSENG